MNDAAVKAIWEYMTRLEASIRVLEGKVEFLKGQVKARLKEEAETRIQGIRPRREKAHKMGPD